MLFYAKGLAARTGLDVEIREAEAHPSSTAMRMNHVAKHDLTLWDLDLSDTTLLTLDLSHVNAGPKNAKVKPVVGVLGADALWRRHAVIDCDRGLMLFRHGSSCPCRVLNHQGSRGLDGFIDHFLTRTCRARDCRTCGYCHAWTSRVVRINEDWRRECLALYERAFTEMESGQLWGFKAASDAGSS